MRFRRRRDRLRLVGATAGGQASPLHSRASRAVVLSGVRTPIGRYGGALSGVRPDDLAAMAIAAAVERAGVDPASIDDVYFGARTRPARTIATSRAWPRSSPGYPSRSPASRSTGCARPGCPSVVSALPRGHRRRCGRRRRGWRRVDEPCAARHGEAGQGLPARRPDRLRHHARLALPEPATRGDVPARVDGRDRRERRGAVDVSREDQDAFALAVAAALGRGERAGRFDDELVPVGDVTVDEHPRPETAARRWPA